MTSSHHIVHCESRDFLAREEAVTRFVTLNLQHGQICSLPPLRLAWGLSRSRVQMCVKFFKERYLTRKSLRRQCC